MSIEQMVNETMKGLINSQDQVYMWMVDPYGNEPSIKFEAWRKFQDIGWLNADSEWVAAPELWEAYLIGVNEG